MGWRYELYSWSHPELWTSQRTERALLFVKLEWAFMVRFLELEVKKCALVFVVWLDVFKKLEELYDSVQSLQPNKRITPTQKLNHYWRIWQYLFICCRDNAFKVVCESPRRHCILLTWFKVKEVILQHMQTYFKITILSLLLALEGVKNCVQIKQFNCRIAKTSYKFDLALRTFLANVGAQTLDGWV